MPSNESQKLTGKPDRLAFDYIKSQYFRVIRADGAIGSVTPNGHIHFALYSERAAIPRRLVQELSSSGELGALIPEATESRESIVREMDVDVFVTLEVAVALHQWLGNHIEELSGRASPQQQESGGETRP